MLFLIVVKVNFIFGLLNNINNLLNKSLLNNINNKEKNSKQEKGHSDKTIYVETWHRQRKLLASILKRALGHCIFLC